MNKSDEKFNCCGCKTCGIVCPKSCINFQEDSIGALYPIIDGSKCVDCGRCKLVCPIRCTFENNIGVSAYVAFSKDDEVRFRGSSGGVFETMASYYINNHGFVYASKFDDKLQLKCFEATTMREVREQTKSKYLQSDCSFMFPNIMQNVQEGRQVLFCGTPCQVTALKLYLGCLSKQSNIALLDFFCHGVPSQDLFDKCINFVENRDKIRIISYEFRTKKHNGGVTPHYYSIEYLKSGVANREIKLYLKDPFYLGYQKYITLRDSCYNCPYGKGNHSADITIGDFHDIDKYISGINRFDGVSTVLINTEKGNAVWDKIKNNLTLYEININRLYADKQIYTGGTQEPKSRFEFIADIETKPFDEVVDKWFNPKHEWKKEIYYSLPNAIRKQVKKIMSLW